MAKKVNKRILINSELHKKLKIFSAKEGRSMKEIVEEAITEYLRKEFR